MMNLKKAIKHSIAFALAAIMIILCSCGSATPVDYENEVTFEAALNNGENLVGKTVRFTALELRPQSIFGYNIFAGEHLNFVSTENPDVNVGDIVTAKVTKIESILGSWIIGYEKISVSKGNSTYISNYSSSAGNSTRSSETIVDAVPIVKSEFKLASTIKMNSGIFEMTSTDNTAESFKSNDFFEVVDICYLEGRFSNSLIIKISGKSDAQIKSSAVIYDASGNVIGKKSNTILAVGYRDNYFNFDISDNFDYKTGRIEITATAKPVSEKYENEFTAVIMEKCNISDNYLYVTVKQEADKIDTSGEFKFIFYKDGKIVGTDTEYLYSSKLNGNGSTDVVEIWLYGKNDFDEVEFIYEPTRY